MIDPTALIVELRGFAEGSTSARASLMRDAADAIEALQAVSARAVKAEALEAFADHYEKIAKDVERPIATDSPADYWRGADDAVGHFVASLRSAAQVQREGLE